MPWQYCNYIRRPFQSLFFSMDFYYKQSQELYKKIHAQDFENPSQLDQKLWMEEKSASRTCFIMGIAAIEAFANNILRDFAVRNKGDLPVGMLNKSQKDNPIDRWRLIDKVYFMPTLCNAVISPPASFFNRKSKEFILFEELVEIRNTIMHGRPETILMLMKYKSDNKPLLSQH